MLWEILKASKGILVADFYADLWAVIAGGGTPVDVFVEMIGSLPLYYNGKGYDLTDYLISGNTVQDGTPSADAPVDATGCGVRTGNLFDATTLENGIYLAASGNKYGDATNGVRSGTKIKVLPNTTYTLSAQSSANVSLRIFEWASGTFTKQTQKYNISGSVSLTVTTTAETTEIAFNIEGENGQYATNVMLNLGSTALPYEPYGFKLDISNGGENLAWTGWAQDFVSRINSADRASMVTDDGRECLRYNVSAGYEQYDTKYIFKTEWKENTRYSISFYGKRPTGMTATTVARLVYTDDTFENINVQAAGVGNYVRYAVVSAAGKTIKSLCAHYSSGSFIIDINTFMVNEGDTAKPYSPYNRTTTPIYLGTVPTTRRVKKLVLTGEETWDGYADGRTGFRTGVLDASSVPQTTVTEAICSHFTADTYLNVYNDISVTAFAQRAGSTPTTAGFIFRIQTYRTREEFIRFLKDQYAAGTPVTVWYVLAEPETTIVNEPLMKIGNYADTVSFEQAGVTIPTVNGANVLDMTSTVKPSEVYIKGKGIKPTGYGQLADVNGVNILDKDGRPIYGRASDRR